MGPLNKTNTIRVVTASKSPLVLRGLTSMLADETDIKVAEASSIIEIMDCIYNDDPDVLIIDAINGTQTINLETIGIVRKKYPNINVLFIIEKYDASKELIALKNGVRGILCECADKSELAKSIRAVGSGKLWIRQHILEKFIVNLLPLLDINRQQHQRKYTGSLTKRELDIIKLVIRGNKNKEIGKKLFVTEKTVKNHLSSIFKKLKIKKRVELYKYQLSSSF